MNIKAKIFLIDSTNKTKALASITLEESFVVTGLKIIESNKGDLFLSMPNRKAANGEYKDTCFPITKECRQQIIDEVMAEYYKAIGKNEQQSNIQEETPFFGDDLPF